jgi:hypothetical protein
MRVLLALTLAVVASALASFGVSAVSAQTYPEPSGACTLVVAPVTPEINSDAFVLVQVFDADGNPAAGVAGTATITPANADVTIDPVDFVTGPDGTAQLTLHIGTYVGPLTITAICSADLTTQATVPVGGEVGPPDTGAGPDSSNADEKAPFLWLAGIALATVAAGGAAVAIARRR